MFFNLFKYQKIVILFLITNQFCFGFQSRSFGTKTKTDSISYYLEKNNTLKALNYAREKSKYFLENEKYADYCDIMIEKSELFRKFNDIENTLKVLYEARNIAEKNKLLDKQVLIYRGIGNANSIIFEYTMAKKYLFKANKIALQLNDNNLLSKVNQGLLKIHYDTDSDSTEYYLKKTAYYSQKSTDLQEKYKNFSNFSAFYISKKNNVLAKKYLDSTYFLACKIGNKENIASAKNSIGAYYLTVEKDYKKSLSIFFEILNMLPKSENSNNKNSAYLNISYCYEKMGDYKRALDYTNEYLETFENVSSGRLNKVNQELETKYTINKVENEFKEKEKLINEKQDKNQKLLLLFASLFILAGFIFYFYYQNLLLKQKNKLKDIDNQLQYKIISATLDGQDQERTKISAVLHDHVSAVLSSVGLHLSAFESSLNKEQIADLKKLELY